MIQTASSESRSRPGRQLGWPGRPYVFAAVLAVVCWGLTGGLAGRADAACPNEPLRVGASASLPDCRAYELVSPPNTSGLRPTADMFGHGKSEFDVSLVSPDGESVTFNTVGGELPGLGGTGVADRYEAVRGGGGWQTRRIGPTAAETEQPVLGGITSDHEYAFFATGLFFGTDRGSWTEHGQVTSWLRRPSGEFEPTGQGELATAFNACGKYITPHGTHIVFESRDCEGQEGNGPPVQLLDDAPPDGVVAVYDRTPAGLRTVSLLPGDVTPSTSSRFQGASGDGSVILFANPIPLVEDFEITVGRTLYARIDNSATREVVTATNGTVSFAGASQDGASVFYVEVGNVFSFDTASGATTPVVGSGDAELVNISADGSHVYFVSGLQLDGSNGTVGAPNLYVWDRASGTTRFIATVDAGDTTGVACLTCWTSQVANPEKDTTEGSANELSRTTPDGSVLVFESHAQLTPYDNGGHSEVYRYDGDAPSAEALVCVSCNPSDEAAETDATLESAGSGLDALPLNALNPVANLTSDGSTVFFQTGDALVATDTDGLQDVYEWRDGEISLISSGQSAFDDFLWGVTPSGRDAFILTSDKLVAEDENGGAGAIYDARVDGGFAFSPPSPPCQGDACQGQPTPPPGLPGIGSQALVGKGNPHRHRRHCQRHKRRAQHRRKGRSRCSKRHRRNGGHARRLTTPKGAFR